jgi:hypothetical protein
MTAALNLSNFNGYNQTRANDINSTGMRVNDISDMHYLMIFDSLMRND